MSVNRPTNAEQLAALETKVAHMETEQAKMVTKVDEMHAVLMQAKGVRWAIIAFVGLVSLMTGSVLPWLFHRG